MKIPSMKRLFIILLPSIIVIWLVTIFAQNRYKKTESIHSKSITDHCIGLYALSMLNTYYQVNNYYPDEKQWANAVLPNGQPAMSGCGSTGLDVNYLVTNYDYIYVNLHEVSLSKINVTASNQNLPKLKYGDYDLSK